MLVNHAKNQDELYIAIAAGEHIVEGHPYISYSEGAAPNNTEYIRYILGIGDWESAERIWYELAGGTIVINAEDYRFFDGTQMESSEWFPMDSPHTGFVVLDIRIKDGILDPVTEKTPPTGLRGKFKTEKFPDVDEHGNQIDEDGVIVTGIGQPLDKSKFTYTASPARVIAGRAFKYGGIARNRFSYPALTRYRDFCAGTEENDYTSLPDFEGFGLSASYYNGANFEDFVLKRLDASVYFALSAGAPATGVNADSFSVRWEGFIKFEFTESYTFTIQHTDAAKLAVGSTTLINETSEGTHTATFNATAGTFYPITIEWKTGSGDSEIILKWNSANTPIEIVKPKNLYPKTSESERYQLHDAYSTPTTLDQMFDVGLVATNSIRQDVNGQIELYCIEQLEPSFHFDYTLPEDQRQIIDGTFKFGRGDVRTQSNVFKSDARNLASEYLEKPEHPPRLASGQGSEIVTIVPLPTMEVWQMYKVLLRIINLAVIKDLTGGFQATKKAYKVVSGDVVEITHEAGAFERFLCQITSAVDLSDEKAGVREFRFQEI